MDPNSREASAESISSSFSSYSGKEQDTSGSLKEPEGERTCARVSGGLNALIHLTRAQKSLLSSLFIPAGNQIYLGKHGYVFFSRFIYPA